LSLAHGDAVPTAAALCSLMRNNAAGCRAIGERLCRIAPGPAFRFNRGVWNAPHARTRSAGATVASRVCHATTPTRANGKMTAAIIESRSKPTGSDQGRDVIQQ